ncbi:hypothetical protein CEN46_25215 [Fischerella thermalis CCMEE 5318]|uniref:Uncharacterized protein n=1 Tax=Fischerella thermalis CCMEE 5318 TaxID=2019666 RepID=A0A2N6L4P7_9CYAN|nr:hypothetical protein CEN46_25215 [Fischerella thermalis CCMEE 5318]
MAADEQPLLVELPDVLPPHFTVILKKTPTVLRLCPPHNNAHESDRLEVVGCRLLAAGYGHR